MTDEASRAILRGHCPNCDAHRNAEVLAEDTIEEEHQGSGIWCRSTYSILRCLGCDGRYIRLVQLCSEDTELDDDPETGELIEVIKDQVTYWPSPSPSPPQARRPRPAWLGFAYDDHPELSIGFASDYPELATLLSELYTALDNGLQTLATIGMRTVFDCASQKLGTDPNQSFTEKLKELTAGNKIGGEEREMLSVLADAGSAAAHRGWKPTEDDIDHLMGALENFLERAFVPKHNIRRVKKNIPPALVVIDPSMGSRTRETSFLLLPGHWSGREGALERHWGPSGSRGASTTQDGILEDCRGQGEPL